MDDVELIRLLSFDKNKGMEQLIKQYSGLVFSIVNGRLCDICDSSEIDDCVSDIFIRFFSEYGRFDPDKSSLKTYIGVMAKNAALNLARDKKRTEPIDGDGFIEIPDTYDLEDEAAEKELVDIVIRQIKLLGPPDSDIIFRKYYLDQSTKQIAAELKMKPSAVDVRAHRAMEKLRKSLGGLL